MSAGGDGAEGEVQYLAEGWNLIDDNDDNANTLTSDNTRVKIGQELRSYRFY